ncbi:small integral membrane protein 13 [Protopterus annectens]|uniref:small integral membrane protein 13 n=1 Tax=Protopterus annectens TaxID=7888 RepID=UPI001CFA1D87|nr:small integral membrane protein 13 [Protopterus annectens]
MWQSVGLTLLVTVSTLICVLLFMVCGWYVVWQLFLSKFKFLRELVGDTGSLQEDVEPTVTEAEPELSTTSVRSRQKLSRHRRLTAEDAAAGEKRDKTL